MNWQKKIAVLEAFYNQSFGSPQFVADVKTSGSYAKKVRRLAELGSISNEHIEFLCQQVDHLRRSFKIMDDIIDEDIIRDEEPAFWTVQGIDSTVEQAAWHVKQARQIAIQLGTERLFEQRLREVIEGASLEVEMENPDFVLADPHVTWWRVIQKECAFRLYLAETLGCSPAVCDAARADGVAAQMLDDGLSAIYGKDGRVENSDEKLGRLTYMRAFSVSAEKTVKKGRELKAKIAPILKKKEEK